MLERETTAAVALIEGLRPVEERFPVLHSAGEGHGCNLMGVSPKLFLPLTTITSVSGFQRQK